MPDEWIDKWRSCPELDRWRYDEPKLRGLIKLIQDDADQSGFQSGYNEGRKQGMKDAASIANLIDGETYEAIEKAITKLP